MSSAAGVQYSQQVIRVTAIITHDRSLALHLELLLLPISVFLAGQKEPTPAGLTIEGKMGLTAGTHFVDEASSFAFMHHGTKSGPVALVSHLYILNFERCHIALAYDATL